MQKHLDTLGDPDITLAGLSIWVHGRQFPNASDYWDGNWLYITAVCRADQATVSTSGALLHIPELHSWREDLSRLTGTLSGSAELKPMEPGLHVTLTAESLGHIALFVSITPDHLTQRHELRFTVDQSFVSPVLRQLDRLFMEYPVKGHP